MNNKVKRLNNRNKANIKQKSIEEFIDSYALIEWDPKRNGLIYGIVKFNSLYKPWEPEFNQFKIGSCYMIQTRQNGYPHRSRLCFRGSYKECQVALSDEFFKKESWIQLCHAFDVNKSNCDFYIDFE